MTRTEPKITREIFQGQGLEKLKTVTIGVDAGIPIQNELPELQLKPLYHRGRVLSDPKPWILSLFLKAQNACLAVKSPISTRNGPPPAVACHMEMGVFVQHSATARQHAGTHFLVQDPKVSAGL